MIFLHQDPEYKRFGCTIDIELAQKHYGHWKDRLDGLRKRLEELNQAKKKEVRFTNKLTLKLNWVTNSPGRCNNTLFFEAICFRSNYKQRDVGLQ